MYHVWWAMERKALLKTQFCVVFTILICLPTSHLFNFFFLFLSIFEALWLLFSGWGSPVGSFLISETSTFTIDNGDEARQGRRNPDVLLQIGKEGALLLTRIQKSTSTLTTKKKFKNFILKHHISDFLLPSSLHRTSAVAVQNHRRSRPLVFARRRLHWYMYDALLQQMPTCG